MKTICKLVDETREMTSNKAVLRNLWLIKNKAGKMEDRLLKYCNAIEDLGFIRAGREYYENGPVPLDWPIKSWNGRTNYNGHEMIEDENGDIVYEDNRKTMQEFGVRPCKKCGLFPDENGDDPCIAGLGKVINACCGHGNSEGYIQFDNGITIRGWFTVEREVLHDQKD